MALPSLPDDGLFPVPLPAGAGSALSVQGDALRLPLRDASVDLVVTSPPYFAMRRYEDEGGEYAGQVGSEPTPEEFLAALHAATKECFRVLKPSGSLFVNLSDKFNSAASNQNGLGSSLQGGSHEANRIGRGTTVDLVPRKSLLGLPWRYALGVLDVCPEPWVLRSDLVWNKTNAMPDPTQDRAQRRHEYVFHFTRSERYYAQGDLASAMFSVWDMATEPSRFPEGVKKHPAPFPPELPRRLVQAFCPPGGVVLDPFGGSGTTAMAARALGRTGLSLDLSAAYARTAAWRVGDALSLNKVASRK